MNKSSNFVKRIFFDGGRWLFTLFAGALVSLAVAEWRWRMVSEPVQQARDGLAEEIPVWVIAVLLGIVVLGSAGVLALRWRKRSGVGIHFVTGAPLYGYDDVGFQDLFEVKWFLRVARPSPFASMGHQRSKLDRVEDLDVRGPYCPTCESELHDHQALILGWRWKCQVCGFSTRSGRSRYQARAAATSVFKSAFLRELNEREPTGSPRRQ